MQAFSSVNVFHLRVLPVVKQILADTLKFAAKHRFIVCARLETFKSRPINDLGAAELLLASKLLATIASTWKKQLPGYCGGEPIPPEGDVRMLRAHLIVEETSEVLAALANCDEVELMDALVDLIYVVGGSAHTFGLPLEAAWNEVQRSNMTKAERRPEDARLTDKGPTYEPPKLKEILENCRQEEILENYRQGRAAGAISHPE